jgi:hypothetical protein
MGMAPLAQSAALRSPAAAIALQRSIGNRRTSQLIQAKLTIGAANDPLEREADRVADRVVSGATHTAQTAQTAQAGGQDVRRNAAEEDELMTKRVDISRAPQEEDELMTKRDGMLGAFDASPAFERQLRSAGGGNPLDKNTRSEMERGIGADFSQVRVHTGAQASSLNRSISAQAFTRGSDVFFSSGKYNPGSAGGKRLLAHELTHVVQQGGAAQGAQRKAYPPLQRNVIQRYPATVTTSAVDVDWAAQTSSVSKSGEGVSGGVFFFNSAEGAVRKVVIKPEYVWEDQEDFSQHDEQAYRQTGANAEVSDAFLGHMNVNRPGGRMLIDNMDEYHDILQVANEKGNPIPLSMQSGMSTKYLKILRVMEMAGGGSNVQSLSGIASEANTDDGMSKLLARLSNSSIMRKIGALLAFDAFMRNNDRVIAAFGSAANIGNIMLSDNDVFAIDNNALFSVSDDMPDVDLNDIENLFSNRAGLYDTLFQGIRVAIADPMSVDHFNNLLGMMGNTWRKNLDKGIDEGMAQIRQRLRKKNRAGLKQTFQNTQDSWSVGKYKKGADFNLGQNWDRLRERQKYMKLRMAGKSDDESKQSVAAYARYRQARAQKPTGLKWTAKLKYKMGKF